MEIEHRTSKDKWNRDRTIHICFLPGRDGHGHHSVQENIVMYYNITNYNVSMVNLPFNSTPTVKWKMQSEKGNKW